MDDVERFFDEWPHILDPEIPEDLEILEGMSEKEILDHVGNSIILMQNFADAYDYSQLEDGEAIRTAAQGQIDELKKHYHAATITGLRDQ